MTTKAVQPEPSTDPESAGIPAPLHYLAWGLNPR